MDFNFFDLFDISESENSTVPAETDQIDPDTQNFLIVSQNEESESFAQNEHDFLFNNAVHLAAAALQGSTETTVLEEGISEMFAATCNDEVCSAMDADVMEGNNATLIDDVFGPVFRFFDDIYYCFFYGSNDIVTQNHFSADGSMDLKNNVLVEGNVAHDIQFTEQQTHGSCSLMAQEQFVHRYTGQPIPEEYLEWKAQKWGVYSPDLGTDVNGQTMVLKYFQIPHEQSFNMDIDDLNNAISENKDIIIGVDAREFYGDASCPPGSGHAVAIVGRGVNPTTHEIEGFYVTDSNFPQSAHFITVEKMQESWHGDMITIPEKAIA